MIHPKAERKTRDQFQELNNKILAAASTVPPSEPVTGGEWRIQIAKDEDGNLYGVGDIAEQQIMKLWDEIAKLQAKAPHLRNFQPSRYRGPRHMNTQPVYQPTQYNHRNHRYNPHGGCQEGCCGEGAAVTGGAEGYQTRHCEGPPSVQPAVGFTMIDPPVQAQAVQAGSPPSYMHAAPQYQQQQQHHQPSWTPQYTQQHQPQLPQPRSVQQPAYQGYEQQYSQAHMQPQPQPQHQHQQQSPQHQQHNPVPHHQQRAHRPPPRHGGPAHGKKDFS